MKIKLISTGLAMSALSLAASPAFSAEIQFNGFASFVAGQVLDKDELVGGDFRGYDEKLGFQNNSIFAIQARADLKENLSATAQIAAKGVNDYAAKFNWAYLTYEINNEWTAKLGRSRIPYFYYSDFLDVGYAYHWIKPPYGVYDLGGFDSADGITLEYQTNMGDWISRLTMLGGRSDTTINTAIGDADARVADLWFLSWSMNYDWLTLRVVHSEAELTLDLATINGMSMLMDGSTGLIPRLVPQNDIDALRLEKDRATFDGVAISLDNGKFFAVAEYTELAIENSFLADPRQDWYVSGGMRFGDISIFATYEERKSDLQQRQIDAITTPLGVAASVIPSLSTELLTAAGGADAIFNSSYYDNETYSVGLRYNFHPSADFKVEYLQQNDKINDVDPQAIAVSVDLVF